MKPIVYGYTKCSTVKKALNFLESNNIDYKHIDNVTDKLSVKEIKDLHEKSNLDIGKFYNTSGMLYRELNIKDKRANMSLSEQYKLLSTDGMLIKRPILVTSKGVFPSFKEDKWLELI
ncbi:MAG: Spx/MgsR family RNA polymerase-binding regulatory protein [Mycoplasmatales bacterium]